MGLQGGWQAEITDRYDAHLLATLGSLPSTFTRERLSVRRYATRPLIYGPAYLKVSNGEQGGKKIPATCYAAAVGAIPRHPGARESIRVIWGGWDAQITMTACPIDPGG